MLVEEADCSEFDCEQSHSENLESKLIPNNEELIKHNTYFLLCAKNVLLFAKEKHKLTDSVVNMLVSECKSLVELEHEHTIMQVKEALLESITSPLTAELFNRATQSCSSMSDCFDKVSTPALRYKSSYCRIV